MINVWTARISLILEPDGDGWSRYYQLEENFTWWWRRYNKYITVEAPFKWDGATKAIDFFSLAHMIHDWVVGTDGWSGTWKTDDGTVITVRMSSELLHDFLVEENRKHIANRWYRWTLPWQLIKRLFKKANPPSDRE